MFRHSLILIYRHFKRFSISFFINLIGLSTGLVCTLLIYLWIKDELSIDKFNQNDKQLYQVMRNETVKSGIKTEATTPGFLAQELAATMPEVIRAVAIVNPTPVYKGVLSSGTASLYANPQFADKDYLKVFSCDFIEGDKHTILLNKSAISISEEMAMKLFRTTKGIIGKIVKFDNDYFKGQYIVAGVFNVPAHASNQFDVLFSYDLFLERRPEIKEWANGGPSTYLLLKKGTDGATFDKDITAVLKRKRLGTEETLFIQRYSDRYLYGKYENGRHVGGRIVYVRLFSVIAIFIIGIACINFMNLSTAKASGRMKEVGVKKVLGADRRSIMTQYMGEAMLLTFISLFFALLGTELLLPHFNEITGKLLVLDFDWTLIVALFCGTFFTGLLSGSYPAIYLSGFNPAVALNGRLSNTIGEVLIRKGLVVFQFVVSVILIVSVLIIYKQIQFIQTKNLGYDKYNIISFKKEGKLDDNFEAFISSLKNLSGVVNASYMYGDLAGGASSRPGGFKWENQLPEEKDAQFGYLDVDYGLIETLGLKLQSGRPFSKDFGSDSAAIIFNEAAIKAMGMKDPIGKTVDFYGKRQIVGVVKDFHFESLFDKVKPFFFKIDHEKGGRIVVKIKPGTEKNSIENIEKLYKDYNKGFPFQYKFLDDDYQAQYDAENRIAILSRYFAGIAIIVSCLGLFGLASFTVDRRLKEIAIRKTLGCTKTGVVYLLSVDFIKTVLIAILIAFPLSYIIITNWLNGFAYHITLEWRYFIAAGFVSLLMAMIAIGMQILKVAKVNPAEHLKQ